jgi:hypothetical protein
MSIPKVSKDDIHKWSDFNILASHVNNSGVLVDRRFQNVVKFGYNKDIDTAAEETIWAQGGQWQPTAGAETVSIVSSSANDTNGGTGANLLAIFGLDADYIAISELTIALNGTTPVTSTLSYRYMNRMAVALSGTGLRNEGTITVTQSTSGVVLATIPPDEGITQQAVYTVPAGFTAYLQGVYVNGGKTAGGTVPLIEYEVYSYNNLSNTQYRVSTAIEDANSGNSLTFNYPFANPTAEKNTFFINASTSTNNTQVFARFFMRLVANTVDFT